jgi:hypothetical protein
VPDAYLTEKGNGAPNTSGAFTAFFRPQPSDNQPSGLEKEDYPQGSGFATVSITPGGIVTLTGVLADNTAVTASAPLSRGNRWPLFSQLYNKGGFISGMVALDRTNADSDMSAAGVLWGCPARNGQHYPQGWPEPVIVDLLGAKLIPAWISPIHLLGNEDTNPSVVVNVDTTLTITQGGLQQPFVRHFHVDGMSGGKLILRKIPTSDTSYGLSMLPGTGKFSGTFLHEDGTRAAFQGVQYSKGAHLGGHGFFMTTTPRVKDYTGQSGNVHVLPAPIMSMRIDFPLIGH